MVERSLSMREVPGSIPGASTVPFYHYCTKIFYFVKIFIIHYPDDEYNAMCICFKWVKVHIEKSPSHYTFNTVRNKKMHFHIIKKEFSFKQM